MDIHTMLPPTSKRVELNTREIINEKIDVNTVRNLMKYKNANKDQLTERLHELNREWDTERMLEFNAATLILTSTILGNKKHRAWFILTGLVSFFLLQHATQGWCPPLEIIRRFGFRTAEEIQEEKMAIKLFRGDFGELDKSAWKIFKRVQKE